MQQVWHNEKRFPSDFMFQLNKSEAGTLRSQIATSNTKIRDLAETVGFETRVPLAEGLRATVESFRAVMPVG